MIKLRNSLYFSEEKKGKGVFYENPFAESSRFVLNQMKHNSIKTTIQTTLSNSSLYTHKPL